jgi:segregation and condensation protein B
MTPRDFMAEGGREEPNLTAAQLEALLFVAERPLERREIARLAGVDPADVDACLAALAAALVGRGIRLLRDGERVSLVTAPEAGPLVARYLGIDPVRLSPAALETLAIIAYRQPITRAAIERIRGVDAEYALRVLLHRRLVQEVGRAERPGRPILYGTTVEFLRRFGLTSLADLPPLDPDLEARLADLDGQEGGPPDPDRGRPEPEDDADGAGLLPGGPTPPEDGG